MQAKDIVELLKQKANPAQLAGMQRFGIDVTHAIGVNVPELRKLAKTIKKNHLLALEFWDTGLHEARILASMVDDAALVTEQQTDNWTRDFNSWDLCDQVCGNLFDRTPFAIPKAIEFSTHDQEFIKRAGFVLMAEFAVHHKTAPDETFIALMLIIERES